MAMANLIKSCISKLRISELYRIKHNFASNELFDNRAIDKEIEDFALKLDMKRNEKTERSNVAFLATALFDQGGHSVLIRNILRNVPKNINAKLFLTRKKQSMKIAKKRTGEIAACAEIDGVDFYFMKEKKLLKQMFDKIVAFSPKTIFAFIHMNDSFAAALLALIKKHTDINVLFVNFAAHHPSLGMSFADLILEMSPVSAFVTQKCRGFANTYIIWLVGENEERISNAKANLKIPKNHLCSMTGCASYKLLQGDSSPFLEMIYRLLAKNKNLCHVLITDLNDKLKFIIDSVFEDSEIRKRLIILDFAADYKPVFRNADVFIDSFPISNDLTMVDLMSLKIPFVFMINRENITQSFNEYAPKNYPYAFDNVADFERGAEKLLFDKQEQSKIAEINYEHFLRVFEGKKAAKRIFDLINCDDFSKLYCKINEDDYKDYKEPKLIPI
jgi:hypothetical protein